MTSQANREENLLSDCVSSLQLWKELIDKHLQGEEKSSEIKSLEEIVKDFCVINFNSTKNSRACQEVQNYFDNNESSDFSVDVDELYKQKLAENPDTFNGNYQDNTIWKQVFTGISDRDVEEVLQSNNETAMETEYEEMHDSIFYSNVFTPPVDPISKMVIKDPYKNRICGHIYEYKFILQYIKSRKNKAKCPYIGCRNSNFTVTDLVKDDETKNKIDDYLKNKPHSSDSDD